MCSAVPGFSSCVIFFVVFLSLCFSLWKIWCFHRFTPSPWNYGLLLNQCWVKSSTLPLPLPFFCSFRLGNASLLYSRFWDRHTTPLLIKSKVLRDNESDGCVRDRGNASGEVSISGSHLEVAKHGGSGSCFTIIPGLSVFWIQDGAWSMRCMLKSRSYTSLSHKTMFVTEMRCVKDKSTSTIKLSHKAMILGTVAFCDKQSTLKIQHENIFFTWNV